jgi:hypothetical protein
MVLRRWLGVGGVLGPFALVTAALVVAANRQGYSHSRQAISELGEKGGELAALMNFGGFLVYGLLVAGLAFGLHTAVERGRGDWLGTVLLGLYGLCYVAVAFAPCDPGCTGSSGTPHEKAHILIGRLIIMLSFATPLLLYPRLARDPNWLPISPLLVILPVLSYASFLGLVPGVEFGVSQRLWIGCTLLWVLVLGVQLLRSDELTATTGGTSPLFGKEV